VNRLRVGLRQAIGGVDGRVRGDIEEQQLGRTGDQDLERRPCFVRERRLGDEGCDQRLQLSEAAQACAEDRAREACIARRKGGRGEGVSGRLIERPLPAQNLR
jgi:hypothetical protein